MSSRSRAVVVEGTWHQPVAHLLRADEDVWRQVLRKLRVRPDLAKLMAVCKTLHNRLLAAVRATVTCTGAYKLKTRKLGDSPLGPRVDTIPDDPETFARSQYERACALMAQGPVGADELKDLRTCIDRIASDPALGSGDPWTFDIGSAWYWDDLVRETARPAHMDPTRALAYPTYAAAYSRSGFKALVVEHFEKHGGDALMPSILQLDNVWRRDPMRKGTTNIEMLVQRCPPEDNLHAAAEDVTHRYMVAYRPDQYAGNPHAAVEGIGNVRIHHQYFRRKMEATVAPELTEVSFNWTRREGFLMNEYDPLKAVLTPQMQRDVENCKDAALWLNLGPDVADDDEEEGVTVFRHFTQTPGFPRVETAVGTLRGSTGRFALIIVPPRAGQAARRNGDVDRLRAKLAEMTLPQVDARTGLCHAFADESVFTNCLVVRGCYTLDLRGPFVAIENGDGCIPNVFLEPNFTRLDATELAIKDVILRVGIPRQLGGVRIEHARKLVYGACDPVLATVQADADGSGCVRLRLRVVRLRAPGPPAGARRRPRSGVPVAPRPGGRGVAS